MNKSAADSSRQNKVKMILLRRGHIFYSTWEEQREREGGSESVRQINRAGRTDEGRVGKRWNWLNPARHFTKWKNRYWCHANPSSTSLTHTNTKKHAQVKCVCVKDVCTLFMHWTLDCCKLCYSDDKDWLWFWSAGGRQQLYPKSRLVLARFTVTGSEDGALTATLSSCIPTFFFKQAIKTGNILSHIKQTHTAGMMPDLKSTTVAKRTLASQCIQTSASMLMPLCHFHSNTHIV